MAGCLRRLRSCQLCRFVLHGLAGPPHG